MPRDTPQPPPARNVLGGPLEVCSLDPKTGYFRTGCCHTDDIDIGRHVVCAQVTDEFLRFSARRGNDLAAPMPEAGFPGLVAGDRWCLCAARWLEALAAGVAPPVYLAGTHEAALELIDLSELTAHAIDRH